MTLAQVLDQLVDDGWYLKVTPAMLGPKKCWRVWLSWRQGDPPHKEESKRLDTLDEVATWLTNTAEGWSFEDE